VGSRNANWKRETNDPGLEACGPSECGAITPENGIGGYEVGESTREEEDAAQQAEDVEGRKAEFRSRRRV
jgi:hypothetical protein